MRSPECNDIRECCFRKNGRCKILSETFEDDDCPFCRRSESERPYNLEQIDRAQYAKVPFIYKWPYYLRKPK